MSVVYLGEATYELYVRLHREAGWDDLTLFTEEVWNNMDHRGRASAIQQYLVMGEQFKARQAAHGPGWGVF